MAEGRDRRNAMMKMLSMLFFGVQTKNGDTIFEAFLTNKESIYNA